MRWGTRRCAQTDDVPPDGRTHRPPADLDHRFFEAGVVGAPTTHGAVRLIWPYDGGAAIWRRQVLLCGKSVSTLRSSRNPCDVRRLREGSAPSLHSCFSAAGLFRRQTSHFSGSESTPVTLPDAATIGLPGTSEKSGMRFSHSSRNKMISLRASAAPGQRCGPLPNVW